MLFSCSGICSFSMISFLVTNLLGAIKKESTRRNATMANTITIEQIYYHKNMLK